jgi:hypothetical protein
MGLSTGTVSNAGTEFSFPSGTVIYGASVIGFPNVEGGEMDTTTHGSNDGSGSVLFGQREFNNRLDAGNFTIGLKEVTGHSSLYTDRDAGTQRTFHIKGKARQFVGVAWIKSIQPNDADSDNPDAAKLVVTLVPVGRVRSANV